MHYIFKIYFRRSTVRRKRKLARGVAVDFTFMIEEGYDRNHPYISGVVELEEGVRVDARIEEVDGSRPETIKIGTPLTMKFLHRGEGDNLKTFLAFKPL